MLQTALDLFFAEAGSHNRVVLIAPPAEAPLDDRRKEPPLRSFLASGPFFDKAGLAGADPADWCFKVLKRALSGSDFDVDIRVVHRLKPAEPPRASASCETTISHRGPERYLRNCVNSLLQQSLVPKIRVGIDQKYDCRRFVDDVRENPSVDVFEVRPNPVGPYVVLHVLSHLATADYIGRQDSDDVSLRSRMATLIDAAERTGAGLVGSHEIQLHEVRQEVIPVRYPADVNRALALSGPGHQALLPMTIVRRDLFQRVGGFSTDRIFSLDVNFWLAASLQTKLINVDEFLYVRRRHPSSLTMREDIGNFSPVRIQHRLCREADFRAIVAGRLKLEDSSLAISHREGPVTFRNVRTGVETQVILNQADTFRPLAFAPAGLVAPLQHS